MKPASIPAPPRMHRGCSAQVAARLGIGEDHVFAAFEDALYYLWRERKLPANVDLGPRR